MVLCDRLVERDVARLEHERPGITAAARAVTDQLAAPRREATGPGGGCAPAARARAPWEPLLPLPGDLDGLNDLLSELDAALRTMGART